MIELLADVEPSVLDADDPDHTSAWFVVADRFHRYGIEHEPTLARVRSYIASRKDLKMMAACGMSDKDLRAREKVLDAFLRRISQPHPKPFRRRIFTKPQELILEVGDLVTFPLGEDAEPPNPYFPYGGPDDGSNPDGYGAVLVVDSGLSFGFLAWYMTALLGSSFTKRPSLKDCVGVTLQWPEYGTLSASHYKRMNMEVVTHLDLAPDAPSLIAERCAVLSFDRYVPSPEQVTASDISLSNRLRRVAVNVSDITLGQLMQDH